MQYWQTMVASVSDPMETQPKRDITTGSHYMGQLRPDPRSIVAAINTGEDTMPEFTITCHVQHKSDAQPQGAWSVVGQMQGVLSFNTGSDLAKVSIRDIYFAMSKGKLDKTIAEGDSSTSPRSMNAAHNENCLLYTSPSPRDRQKSRMPSSA